MVVNSIHFVVELVQVLVEAWLKIRGCFDFSMLFCYCLARSRTKVILVSRFQSNILDLPPIARRNAFIAWRHVIETNTPFSFLGSPHLRLTKHLRSTILYEQGFPVLQFCIVSDHFFLRFQYAIGPKTLSNHGEPSSNNNLIKYLNYTTITGHPSSQFHQILTQQHQITIVNTKGESYIYLPLRSNIIIR